LVDLFGNGYIKVSKVAKILGRSRQEVQALVESGDLEAVRLGNPNLRIRKSSLAAFLERTKDGNESGNL